MRLLGNVILVSNELEGDNGCNGDSDCDDIYDRPYLPRKVHPNDWVVNCRRDTQNPYPSLMSILKRLESKVSKDAAADPS